VCVVARYRCPRLAHLDRATGAPVRRYERARPGELVHVDVNGSCYQSFAWRDALAAAAITHKRTRPRRPREEARSNDFPPRSAACSPVW